MAEKVANNDLLLKMFRGKLTGEEVGRIVAEERGFDILGTRVEPGREVPVDVMGFSYKGLTVDSTWVPFNWDKPELGGDYEVAANRTGEHVTVLGKIPARGDKDTARRRIGGLLGEVLVVEQKGLPDLALPGLVNELIAKHFPKLELPKVKDPSLN